MPHISVCWPSWGQLRHSSEHPSLHSACTTIRHKGFKRVEAQFERAEQSCGTSRCQGARCKSSSSIPSPAVTRVRVPESCTYSSSALAATHGEAALAVWRVADSGLTDIPFTLPAFRSVSPPGIDSVSVTLQDFLQDLHSCTSR